MVQLLGVHKKARNTGHAACSKLADGLLHQHLNWPPNLLLSIMTWPLSTLSQTSWCTNKRPQLSNMKKNDSDHYNIQHRKYYYVHNRLVSHYIREHNNEITICQLYYTSVSKQRDWTIQQRDKTAQSSIQSQGYQLNQITKVKIQQGCTLILYMVTLMYKWAANKKPERLLDFSCDELWRAARKSLELAKRTPKDRAATADKRNSW